MSFIWWQTFDRTSQFNNYRRLGRNDIVTADQQMTAAKEVIGYWYLLPLSLAPVALEYSF